MPGAVPGFADLLDTKAMFALATSQDVESRLVIRDGKRWILEHRSVQEDLLRQPARTRLDAAGAGTESSRARSRPLAATVFFAICAA